MQWNFLFLKNEVQGIARLWFALTPHDKSCYILFSNQKFKLWLSLSYADLIFDAYWSSPWGLHPPQIQLRLSPQDLITWIISKLVRRLISGRLATRKYIFNRRGDSGLLTNWISSHHWMGVQAQGRRLHPPWSPLYPLTTSTQGGGVHGEILIVVDQVQRG